MANQGASLVVAPELGKKPDNSGSRSGTIAAGMIAALVLAAALAGQTNTGELAGVVMDASGGVLPGATITATHAASGTIVTRVTDAEGRFFLPALRVGVWDLRVALEGFSPQTRTGILLEIGGALTLEFRLDVEGLSEELTVAPREMQFGLRVAF